MSTDTTHAPAATEDAELDPEIRTIFHGMIAKEAQSRAWHDEMNALSELDALPAWALRALLGAGDGRTSISIERSGERDSRGPLGEFVLKAERWPWTLQLSLDQTYCLLDCEGKEALGEGWRHALNDLADLLSDPRVAGLYRETPRQYASRAMLALLESPRAQQIIGDELRARGEPAEQPQAAD